MAVLGTVIVIGGVSTGVTVGAVVASALAMALSAGLQAALAPAAAKSPALKLQSTIKDPIKQRELVVGKIRKGGTIVFIDTVQADSVLLLVVAIAGHEVEAIDEIYFFDDLIVGQDGVIQPKYRGKVEYEIHLGTDNQSASTLMLENSTKWTAEHRLRGIAYVALRVVFAPTLFTQIPNVTCVVRGAKFYDPRDSQTRFTSNAALVIAGYLNHPIYGIPAAYGSDIDNALLITAANACDEDVAIKAGKVLHFDGNKDYIEIGDFLDQTGAITIEARVNPDVVNIAGMQILDKDSGTAGFSLQVESDKIRFITRGLSNVTLDTAGGQMAAATWKHVAGVWNPATGDKIIYINGSAVATAAGVTGTLAVNTTKLRIGDTLNGSLQDIRLWSVARTPTEVNAFKDKTLTGRETGLAAYWKLDEKIGDRAEDATEIGHDAQITGAVWMDSSEILGTEKRYTANGVIFSDSAPGTIIEELLTSMVGSLVLSGGSWGLRAAVYDAPTKSLSENDARDTIEVQPRRSRRDLFNSVRGTFAAPENKWEQSDFPQVIVPGFETQDGGQRIVQEIVLPYTASSSMAQRIAWLHLLRNREQLSVNFKSKLSGLKLRAGDFCMLSDELLGWTDKEFEVINWQLVQVDDGAGNVGLGIDQELRETAAAIYDFNPATDEIPFNPSPNTNLPSPFGEAAIVSAFIDRTGFADIARVEAGGIWPGTFIGMVPNPLTGHLNVDDQLMATGDDFLVFDSYVRVPVAAPVYELPEMDIGFDDQVRTYNEYQIFKVGGQSGGFTFEIEVDYRAELGEYVGWQRAVKSVVAEGRFFKHRIKFDFSKGTGGYLGEFNAVIDKTLVFQSLVDQVVPPGGRSFLFPEPYHNVPSLSYGVRSAGARTVSFPNISETGFDVLVFDAGADVGGTISVKAQGV